MLHAKSVELGAAPESVFHRSGKFGRLFPALPGLRCPGLSEPQLRELLLDLGAPGGPMDAGAGTGLAFNVPVGLVFFGQFIDHDITFDPTSMIERHNDPEQIANFRTPVLELDSVYGGGPEATPYFYGPGRGQLLVEKLGPNANAKDDLPRTSVGRSIIGDPRNDENLIIARLHLAFLKFHNAVLAGPAGGDFVEARRLVRWHYQWIVLHEFLPAIVGQDTFSKIYRRGVNGRASKRRIYTWRHDPFIPIEFAVAAYRMGHTLIPETMQVNDEFTVNGSAQIPLFDRNQPPGADPDDLQGGFRAERRYVDWKHLVNTGDASPQLARAFDTKLAAPLFALPGGVVEPKPGDPRFSSLASRNLLRGHAFSLPSGQDVARAICETPLSTDAFSDLQGNLACLRENTPLWFYILREADVLTGGQHLGPVGGRIVAEVLIGLLEGDKNSFVFANPLWRPTLGRGGNFRLQDLLRISEDGL